MRVIGIYSRAFCGTTIAMRLLSCIPGTAAVGEVDRLTQPVLQHRHCALCGMGRRCPVFTPEVMSRNYDRGSVLRQVSQLHGGKTIISSDKDPDFFEAAMGKKRGDIVVLLRDPRAVVRSDLERSLRFRKVEASLQFWAQRFGSAEKWCSEWARRHVYVTFESLMERPQDVVAGVAEAFSLPEPMVPDDLSQVRVHGIAGNHRAYTSDRLIKSERWRSELSSSVQQQICESSAMRIYESLDAKSVVPLSTCARSL
jgi:hypothetical protein